MKRCMSLLLCAGLAIAICSACDGGAVTTPKPKPTPSIPSSALDRIETFGGSPLGVWPVGTAAPGTMFRIRNLRGEPVGQVAVQCSVSGGGSIERATATTDSAGFASCGEWTLGAAPGLNTLTATAATIAPVVVNIEGVRAAPGVAVGRYRLEQFNGGPVPAALVEDESGVRLELVEAELVVTPGAFELYWTTRVPGRANAAAVRTSGTVTTAGLRLSLVVSSSVSYFNDTWGLTLPSGELLLAGDDESWPLGPAQNLFRLIR